MFSTLLKRIALSSLLTCSAIALADQSDYKLMIIDDANTSAAILQGHYESVLNQQVKVNNDQTRNYELVFNQCAVSVKLKNFNDAETHCTQAISLLNSSKVPGYKRRELTSFALSNRGVARIMANNNTAALSDFYEAVQISANDLVSHNLNRAKQRLAL
ncbi:hypothetical protein [Pseudoalteromonas mariniglutinosa]|uniref:hypothetical protein n=1 Tax=Pseudoalteromonas mariniglutinosa TaxID=206042 RepID=UPI00384D9E02